MNPRKLDHETWRDDTENNLWVDFLKVIYPWPLDWLLGLHIVTIVFTVKSLLIYFFPRTRTIPLLTPILTLGVDPGFSNGEGVQMIMCTQPHHMHKAQSPFWVPLGYRAVHICSRYMTPAKWSRNKFSVHELSDCEHCKIFLVPLRSDIKSAHISVCVVWLIAYTLRNVWGHINVHSPCW